MVAFLGHRGPTFWSRRASWIGADAYWMHLGVDQLASGGLSLFLDRLEELFVHIRNVSPMASMIIA